MTIIEKVDYSVDIHHHIIEIRINETAGVSGGTCDGCCRIEVTHPFDGENFDYNKVIPKII
jgi:hypothetical protein